MFKLYGYCGQCIERLQSYLVNRKHYVAFEANAVTGVSQGSLLGHLCLYVVY